MGFESRQSVSPAALVLLWIVGRVDKSFSRVAEIKESRYVEVGCLLSG